MALQKVSKQNNINFLNVLGKEQKIKKEIIENENDKIKRIAEEQKSKKLNYHDTDFKNSKSIMSLGHSAIPETETNSKYIKCETSNSIFDSIIDKQNEKEDIFTKNEKQQKEAMAYALEIEQQKLIEKRKKDQERMADNPSTSKKVVFSKEDKKSYSFNQPTNNISIFDDKEFERLPEKSAGENITEINQKKKNEKDVSWKNSGKNLTSKDFISNLVDNLHNLKK
ncbi:MAG TPA: hypothetical protein VMZ91_02965 [Candidatus Paceibacterota bacterium]|nr:hypothetical protein [Candidatus Paceibacterota bacterium]